MIQVLSVSVDGHAAFRLVAAVTVTIDIVTMAIATASQQTLIFSNGDFDVQQAIIVF